MNRSWLCGSVILAALAAIGCGGDEKPVIPTSIKQPPGPDAEAGKGKPKKPADGRGQQEEKEG